MPVERMMHELAQAVPEGTILADESITSRGAVMGAFDFDEPGSMYSIRGGALGWGMPGALGVKMANPDRPVLAIVGDGASLYTVQALWTASRYNIPVVYAICNNRAYRILKVNMEIYLRSMLKDTDRKSDYVGMDFENTLDLAALASAMGVASEKIEDPEANQGRGGKGLRQRQTCTLGHQHRRVGLDAGRRPLESPRFIRSAFSFGSV